MIFTEFKHREIFTFTVTAISFARRWTVTPTSIPGRVVFITVLLTGVLTQVIYDCNEGTISPLKNRLQAHFVVSGLCTTISPVYT